MAVPIAAGEGVSVAAEAPAIEVGATGTDTGPSDPLPIFSSGTIPDSASGPPVGSPAADADLPVGAQGVVLIEDSPPTASTDLASPSTVVGGSPSGAIPEAGECSGGPSLAASEPPGGLPLPVLSTPRTSMGELCLCSPAPTLWDEDAESSAHKLLEKGLRLTERAYRKMILPATRVSF